MSEPTKTIIRKITAVLDLPNRIADQLVLAKAIVKAMTGNAFFPTPVPDMTTVTSHISVTDLAETAAKSKAAGTVQARDVAMQVVISDLRSLTAYVQGIANANPAKAEAIITSAGLKVKRAGQIDKQDFTVKNNSVSGTVDLIAKGIEVAHAAHDWGMCTDGINWTMLTPTLAAHTQVIGLTRGSIVYFRHREILKSGPGGWSQVANIVVT